MRLRDPDLMARYMADRDFTQARLGRYAGVSRQFVWQMLNDPTKRTCTDEVGRRIEEALSVLPGTLFDDSVLHDKQQRAARQSTSRKKAA